MEVSIPLTPMQRRFMLALQARLEARPDIGPTYDELRLDLGLASKSGVFRLVKECEARGRISRLPNSNRGLAVLRPVTASDGPLQDLLASFSDAEILREAARRGLISLSAPSRVDPQES